MVVPTLRTSTRPRSRRYRHLGPYVSGLATVLATLILTLLLTKRALSMSLGPTLVIPPSREARLVERA